MTRPRSRSSSARPGTRPSARSFLVVTAAAVAVYANSLSGGFTFDDPYVARDDPFLTTGRLGDVFDRAYWPETTRTEAGGRPADVPLGPASREGMTYRPLTTLTYAVSRRAFGDGAFPLHLGNVLLHAGVCVLVLLLARRILPTEAGAVGAALLFAVHPVHVEAVAGIVGRAELLAALAWVGALTWGASRTARAAGAPVAAAGVFLLALAGSLAKETAATVPLALAALLHAEGRLRTRYGAAVTGAAAFAWVPLLALRTAALGAPFPGAGAGAAWAAGGGERVLGILGAAAYAARTFAFPRTLLPDVPVERVLPTGAGDPRAWVGAALAALAAFAILRVARRRAGAGWLGGTLAAVAYLPVSHVAFPVNVIAADRLLYLPSVGLCVVVAAVAERVADRLAPGFARRAASVAVVAALALLAARTVARNPAWASDTALFERLVRDAPESARGWARLGQLRREAGRDDEARECWERALARDPGESAALHGMGWLAAGRGTDDGAREALDWFRRLAEANPRDPRPLRDAGWVHLRAGDPGRALESFRAALGLDPGDTASAQGLAEAYLAEAVAAARAGRLDDAQSVLQSGLAAATAVGADVGRLREMLAEVRAAAPPR